MRLLLASSIIVAISIVAWSVHRAYSSKQLIEGLAETNPSTAPDVLSSFPGRYSSIATSKPSPEHVPGNETQESSIESVDGPSPEHVPENDTEKTSFESDESLIESAEEECCPETEVKRLSWEELREKWTRNHGDIPEIDTFITLARKMGNRETMTLEEDRTFLKLAAFFHPVESNIKAYETFEMLFSEVSPDRYRSSYTKEPPSRK